MSQLEQNSTDRLTKIVYTRSPTNDDQTREIRPIQRVQHPADRSSIVLFVQRLIKLFLTLIISLPALLIFSLILPISWLIRCFIHLTCRYHCPIRPCSCTYLSGSDLFWLFNSNFIRYGNKQHQQNDDDDERQTINPSAAAIFYLEGTVNENSLKKILLNRLVATNSRRGSNLGRKLFPRFSQLIISHFSGWMWIDDRTFSIDEHVKEIPRSVQTDEELQSYVSTLISTELPFNRPLWQLHYKNRSFTRPNDSILIFIYHPVLSDGISLLRILLKHIVDNRTTQFDVKARFAGRRGDRLFDYLKAYLFGHLLFFEKLFFNSSHENFHLQSSAKKNCNGTMTRRQVVWSTPFSLTQANRMKLVTRTRMNDLLSTIILSCLRLYLEKYGLLNTSKINCVMPCDLRSNTANIRMGNQLSHLCLELPLDIEGNIPLLWSLTETTKRMKQKGDYATMYLFNQINYLLLPICLANRIISRIYNRTHVWLTTVAAGSSTTLATMSLCNRDVRSVICLNPSVGRSSINFCVTTYADEVRLSVTVDSHLISNPQFFTECFNQQLSVVQDLLAHRRIPGEVRRINRPPRFQAPKKSISSVSDVSDDLTIEEIQTKMTTLQQELLSLKSQFENVDMNDLSSETQRLIITSKLEELRREFRELLIKLQERQCELSGMIPSDEEDEMDPQIRVRLRSASVASKISLRSNEQRQFSSRVNQFDREDPSEYSVNLIPTAVQSSASSSSKMNIIASRIDDQQAGMRRAQSVSICENTRVDMHRRTSLCRSRPTTPARTFSTTPSTIIHLNSNENGKNSS